MMARRTVIKKPSLREMLAEPIVRAVMHRDGVSPSDVVGALRSARQRLNGAWGVPPVDIDLRRRKTNATGAEKLNAPDPKSPRVAWKR